MDKREQDYARLDQLFCEMNDPEPVPSPEPPPKIADVADQLALHYGHVVVLVAEKDPDKDEAVLHYAWRGGYYAARGMLDRMKDIMRGEGEVEDDG